MGLAFFLVMAFFGNGPRRASSDAFAATPLGEKEAIGVMVFIWPRTWRDSVPGHHRAGAHGFAPFRDQTVAEAEGAQTGGVGGVALRPF